MNVGLQRFVDRWLGVPLCALLSAVDRVVPRRTVAAPRRILVILLSEMGSLVLARPLFDRLRAAHPEATVHVLLFARNREALALQGIVPDERILAIDDRGLAAFVPSLLKSIVALRRLAPDAVIDCELFARVSAILAFLSGAPIRAGFHRYTQEGLYRGRLVNRPVLYNPYQHLSRQFLALAGALESRTRPVAKDADVGGALQVPPVRFEPGEVEGATARLHADFPALAGARVVLVYPSGGLLPIRAWPFDSFVALCRALCDEGFAVGVIGLPGDRPLTQRLADALGHPRCVNLAGYTTSVRHLLALFRRAALLVANDGGPGHFAALSPVPAIVLFGPETPLLYGSHAPQSHNFHRALPCSPCLTAYNHRNSPCDGDNQCLKRIGVDEVLAKARELLAAPRFEGTVDADPA